jgi:hypothetical protein
MSSVVPGYPPGGVNQLQISLVDQRRGIDSLWSPTPPDYMSQPDEFIIDELVQSVEGPRVAIGGLPEEQRHIVWISHGFTSTIAQGIYSIL